MKSALSFAVVLVSFCAFALSFPDFAHGQVVINEVLPNPSGSEELEEWVELYNSGSESASVSGYILKDSAAHELVVNSPSIPPGGWLLIFREGSGFSLNNTNEEVITLFNGSSVNPLDSFTYNGSTEGKSWGRIPDGGSVLGEALEPSPGEKNKQPPSPTPAPTNPPTPTPTPIPTPTKTAVSSPKNTPRPSAVSSEEEGIVSDPSEVLGLRNEIALPPPTPLIQSDSKKKFPIAAVLFITGGLGLIGFASMMFFKARKKEYNDGNGEIS